jgi:histidinol-phosphatase (PHP family)
MTRSNLHTHTCFSDGSDIPEKYCEEAICQGFEILGFSDHGPVSFENTFAIKNGKLEEYINSILQLKEKYSDRKLSPDILLGLEIDYIPGISDSFDIYRKEYTFDYLIGSVHLVKNEDTGKLWFIDGPDRSIYDIGLQEVFQGNIRVAVTAYFHQIQSMILDQTPDIIGHMDKIKMYNQGRFFSEEDPWYIRLVDETLDMIRNTGCVVEINTRGVYKKRSDTLFPGPEILKKLKLLNIPVTLVSDAHKPHELSLGFDDALKLLKILGFQRTVTMTAEGWKEIPLGI